MNSRRVHFLLTTAAAGLFAAAAATPFAGVWTPTESARTSEPSPRTATTAAVVPTGAVPTIESFEPALARSFRPSVGRPAAEQPAVVAKPESAPSTAGLQLVGTVGDSVAMIRGPDGTVALAEVGDDIDGSVIVAIHPSRVDLRQNGKLIVLQKAPPAPDASGVVIR